MNKVNWNALVSALQDFLRIVLLSVIPVLMMQVNSGEFDWNVIWTAAIIGALKALDTYLHKVKVETPLNLTILDGLKK